MGEDIFVKSTTFGAWPRLLIGLAAAALLSLGCSDRVRGPTGTDENAALGDLRGEFDLESLG